MSSDIFISTGLWGSLLGTFLGGLIALFAHNKSVQRIAQIVMLLALAIGSIASGAFLLFHLSPLTILNIGGIFPGELVLDLFSAIFFFLVCTIGFFATLYGVKYLSSEGENYNTGYIQFLTAVFLVGMQMVVLATNIVFFLFSWEVMSLSSFFLVIADFKKSSIRAASFYLIITHLGAGAILAGFLLLSGGSLTADLSQIALAARQLSPTVLLPAFFLFFFGFGSKAGLFPFHGWLPEAHPQAPSHISALMSGVMLKIAVYGFLRVVLFILPPMPAFIGIIVLIVGLFSALFGVLYTLIETDIKRILAFSSIENLGMIFAMIGVFMVTNTSYSNLFPSLILIIAIFQSVCHAFFKSGLFMAAGIAIHAFHTRNIEKMGGMAKNMKLFSFASLLLVLTAAALPPSGAFVSEWFAIQSMVGNMMTGDLMMKAILIVALIGFGLVSGLAVFSMVRFFGIAFLATKRTPNAHIETDPSPELLLPVVFLGLFAFILGPGSPFVFSVLVGDSNVAASMSLTPSTPMILFGILLMAFVFALIIKYLFSRKNNERVFHSWDCGQPIDSSMEYTATAFAAPIRFFFRLILRANKNITSTPLVATNPWFKQKSITLEVRPIWDQYFYKPIVHVFTFFSRTIRRLQSGIIQHYIALILVTLIITMIVAL